MRLCCKFRNENVGHRLLQSKKSTPEVITTEITHTSTLTEDPDNRSSFALQAVPPNKSTLKFTTIETTPTLIKDPELRSSFTIQDTSCITPFSENGTCLPYKECPFLNELLQTYDSVAQIPKYFVKLITQSKCSAENEPIRLCCKLLYNNVRLNIKTADVPEDDNAKSPEDLDSDRDFKSQLNPKEQSCITPDSRNGFCVPYKDCPFANELIQKYGNSAAIPKHYLSIIFQSKCSRDNEPIRLCCEIHNNIPAPQQTAQAADPSLTEDLDYNKDYISQFNQQGFNILNGLSCGQTPGDRVAGGNETALAEFPWMALLRYDAPGDEFKCGGSLISNRFVLTATHCVNKGVYPVIGVRLGEHDIKTDPDCRQLGRKKVCNPIVEDFGIDKIITHPKYNERRRVNDIALIKLDRNVDFKKHIKPVCLPITKQSYDINSNNFIIAGWGATENSTRSSVLLKAEVLGQSRSVCQNVFSSFSLDINIKHICAGDLKTGRDSCRGDSGGPLVAFNTYTNVKRYIQYGVVASGGIACNLQQGLPGIYTNVLTYLPWITSNIVV